MSFLAPLFFVALAGLAIPVLLHLTQREKKQVQRFPSLMFVRRIPYQSVRRRKIQNWLLLLVRMAALALIVLAFARPFLSRPDAPLVPGQGAREVVVLLERWDMAESVDRTGLDEKTTSILGVELPLRGDAGFLRGFDALEVRLHVACGVAHGGGAIERHARHADAGHRFEHRRGEMIGRAVRAR